MLPSLAATASRQDTAAAAVAAAAAAQTVELSDLNGTHLNLLAPQTSRDATASLAYNELGNYDFQYRLPGCAPPGNIFVAWRPTICRGHGTAELNVIQ
jgi:hypothetical protein